MSANPLSQKVDQFILEQIDTVPHLEALLLLWNKRPKSWFVEEMAGALYVPGELAETILQDLVGKGLLRVTSNLQPEYSYISTSEEQDRLMAAVDSTYRRELIRVSRMIHSKAPSALRAFARAFRITKDKEKD